MWHVQIIEVAEVSNQKVVIVEDARIAESFSFGGTFLIPTVPTNGYRILASGRHVVPVVCHWEGSNDGDDFIDLMIKDSTIKVVDGYSGMVVSRVGCREDSHPSDHRICLSRFSRIILKLWGAVVNGR